MFDITELEGKCIPLTHEHILAGVRGAVKHHPIALAVNDATDDSVLAEVSLVTESLAFCAVMGNGKLAELFMTSDLQEWASAYQRGETVSPETLYIFKLNADGVGEDQLWIGIQPRMRKVLDFKEGMRIRLTRRHIMLGNRELETENAVALALREATGDDRVSVIVHPLHEYVSFYLDAGQGLQERNEAVQLKEVDRLMSTTTFEDWFCEYLDTDKIQPCEMYIFKQDDSEFIDEDYHGDDRLWIGVDSNPKPSRKTLVRIVDNKAYKELATVLLCDKHLIEMQEQYEANAPHKNVIEVARHLVGGCDRCYCQNDDTNPITYHAVADSITAHVVFLDGSTATWDGHGGVGRLDYLRDNEGGIYMTMEALKDRGVLTFTLENMHEVAVD